MSKKQQIEDVAQSLANDAEGGGYTYEMLRSAQNTAEKVGWHLRQVKGAIYGAIALQAANFDISLDNVNEFVLSVNDERLPFVAVGTAVLIGHAAIQWGNAQNTRETNEWYKAVEWSAREAGYDNIDLVVERAVELKSLNATLR